MNDNARKETDLSFKTAPVQTVKFSSILHGVTDLTPQIAQAVAASGILDGICVVYTPHDTASLLITDPGNLPGQEDLQDEIRRLVPTRVDFKRNLHTIEDAAAHVKSALLGTSLSLVVEDGRLLLSPFHSVCCVEFEDARNREVWVKVVGLG